jgi:YegS/Rv2252/BmrU family lipid kinase
MRLLVIVNPAARRGGSEPTRQVERALHRHALQFEVERTMRPGDARTLVAARGAEFDGIVVCGGDGTIHEALQSLDLERHVLGVVPRGTGNDFAWMNQWPRDVDACVQRIAAAQERRVDIGVWGSTRFHNSIGIGFEGRVNYESHRIRRLRGPIVYLAAVARTLSRRGTHPAEIEWDDGAWRGDLFMASVCIGRRVGGAFRLAPEARNDDGRFDLCLAGDLSLAQILTLLPRTFNGGHIHADAVHMQRSARIRIRCDSGIPVHVDGEFTGLDVRELDLQTLPAALRTF